MFAIKPDTVSQQFTWDSDGNMLGAKWWHEGNVVFYTSGGFGFPWGLEDCLNDVCYYQKTQVDVSTENWVASCARYIELVLKIKVRDIE